MPSQDNPTNTLPPVMPTPTSGKSSGAKFKKSTDPVATSPVVVRPDDPVGGPTSQSQKSTARERREEPRPSDPARTLSEIASRIGESHNILIALSSDPSVDEMSAAIGLTLYLDRIGKRATAIYSGITPNALEFLKPEATFEQKADILQDFVIAINKDKADHLRYKLDGDYVKIFITPYHSSISSDDLEFSYGDYNVDLVIALDVANISDLDDALREHGRIMHDAPVINITNGEPGKLGGIEWSDKSASSVSEMLAELARSLPDGVKIARDEATAFLTGIVAATNRFADSNTTPRTMEVASRLMSYGANQQLISKNITSNFKDEILGSEDTNQAPVKRPSAKETSSTELNIGHDEPEPKSEPETKPEPEAENEAKFDEPEPEPANDDEPEPTKADESASDQESPGDPSLLADLKAAEASLSSAAAEVTPVVAKQAFRLEPTDDVDAPAPEDSSADSPAPEPTPAPEPVMPAPSPEVVQSAIPRVNIRPAGTSSKDAPAGTDSKDADVKDTPAKPSITPRPNISHDTSAPAASRPSATPSITPEKKSPFINPAAANAPEAATAPEINGVPEINYMPLPDDEVLPPPPAPPIDFDSALPTPPSTVSPAAPLAAPVPPQNTTSPVESSPALQPALPPVEPTPAPLGSQPAMQDQIYPPQASRPGDFKIPGL